MTLATLAASQPDGRRFVRLLEILPVGAVGSLCYTEDVAPVTVQVPGLGGPASVLHDITGLEVGAPAPRDDGGVSIDVRVPDEDAVLWRRLRANIGGSAPMRVVLREYGSDDLSLPLLTRRLDLASPQRSEDGQAISFSAVGADLVNRNAGQTRFTDANAPGLRGR